MREAVADHRRRRCVDFDLSEGGFAPREQGRCVCDARACCCGVGHELSLRSLHARCLWLGAGRRSCTGALGAGWHRVELTRRIEKLELLERLRAPAPQNLTDAAIALEELALDGNRGRMI